MGGGPGSHTDLSQFSGACIGETERPASSIQCPTLPCILAYGVMTSVASPSPESEFLPVHPVRPDGLQLSQVHYTARADAPAILHLATNASNELTKKITRLCDLPFVLQSPSTESTQPQTTVCCEFATKGSSSRFLENYTMIWCLTSIVFVQNNHVTKGRKTMLPTTRDHLRITTVYICTTLRLRSAYCQEELDGVLPSLGLARCSATRTNVVTANVDRCCGKPVCDIAKSTPQQAMTRCCMAGAKVASKAWRDAMQQGPVSPLQMLIGVAHASARHCKADTATSRDTL